MKFAGLFLVMSCIMAVGGCAKPEMATKETVNEAISDKQPLKADAVQEASASVKEGEVRDSLEPIPGAKELKPALEQIYFAFDSYTLSQEARDTLGKNASVMKYDPALNVRIEGHCDERGSDEYNLALGEKRARAALECLTALGIPRARIETISYGEEKPVTSAHEEPAWSRNRRDEFVITKEKF